MPGLQRQHSVGGQGLQVYVMRLATAQVRQEPEQVYSEDAKAAMAERGRQALARMRSLPGNEPSNPDPGASA